MASDPFKDIIQAKASSKPEEFYPVKTLKEKGFERYICESCKRHFWSTEERKVCEDSSCSGGFGFIGDSPAKNKLDYVEVWEKFAEIHKKRGYTPIKRYPVIARWNPTVDFTIADIAAFQPYVVTGEMPPPANPLVIPQFCLRFNDIDNVGITGHYSGFVMMGEKEFVPPEKYDVERYMEDHLTWLNKGIGLDMKDITIHEDAWAGGGNLGPSMEFFSRGLELSNQVYMQYEIGSSGIQDLKLKVLDMGEGQERAAWFSQGKASSYESVFPPIMKKLRSLTGVEYDEEFMKKFTPEASNLNVDEVEDINVAWKSVAKKLDMDVQKLKDKMLPLSSLYSVAEHSRTLLFAINDGGLPSNVGGMRNLRVILRRALGFIDKFGWNVKLPEVCRWHADYLQKQYPELMENLDSVEEILEIEKKKYKATRKKTEKTLPKLFDKKLSTEDFLELYDSQGIAPELIRDEAAKVDKKVEVPADFYARLAERQEQKDKPATTKREVLPVPKEIEATKALYYEDYEKCEFEGTVLEIIDGKYVVLDQTVFYPISGGQLSDYGKLGKTHVVDVFKQGPHIIHVCNNKPEFHAGDKVKGVVDKERRIQLAQHHTSTHMVNAAAQKVLGKHIYQAGAKKDIDKAHIDITHYDALTEKQVEQIEEEANKIVEKAIKTELKFVPRQEAEKKYGMAIYQGGAVPGKELRIVDIPGVDVEACGGTHLKNTKEAGKIKIIKTSKVQDGVVRIVFVAGKAAEKAEEGESAVLDRVSELLNVKKEQIPARVEELFKVWKKAKKAAKKSTERKAHLDFKLSKPPLKKEKFKAEFSSNEKYEGDILARAAEILKTQPEHVVKTVKRFLDDIKKWSE